MGNRLKHIEQSLKIKKLRSIFKEQNDMHRFYFQKNELYCIQTIQR